MLLSCLVLCLCNHSVRGHAWRDFSCGNRSIYRAAQVAECLTIGSPTILSPKTTSLRESAITVDRISDSKKACIHCAPWRGKNKFIFAQNSAALTVTAALSLATFLLCAMNLTFAMKKIKIAQEKVIENLISWDHPLFKFLFPEIKFIEIHKVCPSCIHKGSLGLTRPHGLRYRHRQTDRQTDTHTHTHTHTHTQTHTVWGLYATTLH